MRLARIDARMGARTFLVLIAASCLPSARAAAQSDPVATLPPNLVLSNYNSAPVGPYGGLEGSAYAARVDDPSATWFNPAGLARQAAPQISGSAGVYQRTAVAPTLLPNQGGAVQQLPAFVGFTFSPHPGFTAGGALLTTTAWSQETDSQLVTPGPTGEQRSAYSAVSAFDQRVAAAGLGYHGGGPWRVGGGIAFTLMDLSLVQSASDRIADASGLRSALITARASGSAILFRTQAGVQYDTARWRVGGAVHTPGLTIHKSGTLTLDGLLDVDPGSVGTSLFDSGPALEFHQPWEFQGGVAFVTHRLQLEADLQAYTPVSAYPLLSSDQPIARYSSAGPGAPAVVTTQPFGGLISASKGIVNPGAGGHVKVFEHRDLLVHASVGSNRSPVGAEDIVFDKVDLASWTLGVSGTFGKLQFAAGFNHQSGSAADVTLRNLLNGDVVRTDIDVRVTGFIYSLAYKF
jgi:hypothetical protein